MAATLRVKPYPAELAAKPARIAVTGSTGFLASNIVHRLLSLGHTVHGTCRDPAKAKALQELPGARERLKLFKADLISPGSFDEAFDGCEYVLHTASPYVVNVPLAEVQEKLIKPAVAGTENVLASVNKISSIKRVVMTSSCASVYGSAIERGAGHVFTEADWSIVPSEKVLAYSYSKRQAEKKAWEIAEQQSRWDLVVINPPFIFGPPATGRPDGESVDLIRRAVANEFFPACPKIGMASTDVRDVAAAHTLGAFTPGAKGRYIVAAETGDVSQIVKELAELYPGQVKVPLATAPKWLVWLLGPYMGMPRDMVEHSVGHPGPFFSSDKAKRELGINFIDRKSTLKDQVAKMKDLGMLPSLQ